jgi:hypothetical protein
MSKDPPNDMFRDSLWKYTDMSDHELLARTALACEVIALFLTRGGADGA